MLVCADYLSQRGSINRCIREGLFYASDHSLETINLCFNAFTTGFRTFNAQAKLEIFLIAN